MAKARPEAKQMKEELIWARIKLRFNLEFPVCSSLGRPRHSGFHLQPSAHPTSSIDSANPMSPRFHATFVETVAWCYSRIYARAGRFPEGITGYPLEWVTQTQSTRASGQKDTELWKVRSDVKTLEAGSVIEL